MKFIFNKTVRIQSDIETVWNFIADQRFEQDFLPEISRNRLSPFTSGQPAAIKSACWVNGGDIDIKLTNKDLNASIDSIELKLSEQRDRVVVTLSVKYRKAFEPYFFKAHRAIRSLFGNKLSVMVADLSGVETGYKRNNQYLLTRVQDQATAALPRTVRP